MAMYPGPPGPRRRLRCGKEENRWLDAIMTDKWSKLYDCRGSRARKSKGPAVEKQMMAKDEGTICRLAMD